MSEANSLPTSDHPRRALPPPQFGMRTLLGIVTACAVLAALSQWVTPVTIACAVFLILTVVAHVAGNVIGTRLRDLGSGPRSADAPKRLSHAKLKADDFAPATHLGRRQGLGWPIVIATLVGIATGALGGVLWTVLASQGPVGPLNIAVGCLAFAILGGIIAFATFGFVQVGLTALRQAMIDPKH